MATQIRQLVVSFGQGYAGLAARVAYTVFDISNAVVLGPTGAGVAEAPNEPGTYLAAPTFDTSWAGRIEWTIPGVAGVYAVDDYGRVLGGFSMIVASFGSDYHGLAGQVQYAIYDTAGGVLAAATAAGVQESAGLPGVYFAPVFLAAGWSGRIVWSIQNRFGVVTIEDFGPGIAPVGYPPATTPERSDAPERQP